MADLLRRWASRAALGVLLCSGLPSACELPHYSFEPSPDDDGGTNPRPRCARDADCATFSATKRCDVFSAHCVECRPAAKDGESDCGSGLFCDLDHCALGCDNDADCGHDLRCDRTTHRCLGCSEDGDCPSGMACSDASCVPSCSNDQGCPAGFSCCNGTCANLQTDALHCANCSRACAEGEDCINGGCGPGNGCAPGLADCDQNASNGCETNLRSNQHNCGACGNDCAPEYCNGGRCSAIACDDGFADCDLVESNGCEVNLDSVENCGACGKRCSDINGDPACVGGDCEIVCAQGFADCDDNTATGCETNVESDRTHCGDCDQSCANEHGITSCVDGACAPICAQGFADCDGEPENGCETDLTSSLDHCGVCSAKCDPDHASATCDGGVCRIDACDAGFSDCDGGVANGCEADLNSPETCGDCNTQCNGNGGAPSCKNKHCAISCDDGRADCSGGLVNGCETDVAVSVLNCGECGNACETPEGGQAACLGGSCGLSPCDAPLADCNNDFGAGSDGDGCETNITNDPKHCGGCGVECYYPNGAGKCKKSSCALDHCRDGYANCDTDLENGCETPLGSTKNCTACGDSCTALHGTNQCTRDGCQPTCAIGFGDCDGNPSNGCETPLNTLDNCGACNTACSKANASSSCATGSCQIVACMKGYGDCDNEPVTHSGCETRLNSTSDCGACGVPCELPNASASCASGTCTLGTCRAGFADCSQALPGCETQLGKPANCFACGNTCQTAHAAQNECVGTFPSFDCSPTCNAGFKSCDGNPDNGCETDLATPENCGECNRQCALPHTASYACNAGECQVADCEPGFAHCNASQADGCERDVRADVANCGGCDKACSSTHGTPSCADSHCSIACDGGFGDCNQNVADGCEHDVTSDRANCGACGNACPAANPFCVNQSCQKHLLIGVVGTPSVGKQSATGQDLVFSHTLTNDSGHYRLVLVAVAGKGNGTASKPKAVNYGTAAMTLLRETSSGNQAYGGIYAIGESGLPAKGGTNNVQVRAGDAQNSFGFVANALELQNVEQASLGLEASAGAAHGNCSGDDPAETVRSTSEGVFVYGAVALYGGVTPASGIATSSQTITLQAVSGSGLGALAGYIANVGPQANTTISWNPDNCETSAQAVVAIRPAVTP